MQHSKIKASNAGKLILLGEYAVLEKAPCLVAAVDRNCEVTVEPADGDASKLVATNTKIPDVEFSITQNDEVEFKTSLSEADFERLSYVIAVLKFVARENSDRFTPCIINIDTTKFYHPDSGDKLGLGASASITVSLFSALRKYINKPLSGEALYEMAYPIHRSAQGKLGSGSDIAASAVGGVIKYQMPEDVENGSGTITPLDWPQDLQVVPVWAGRSASTQNMVERVKAYRENNAVSYRKIMKPMIDLSREGCKAFKDGDVDVLTEIVTDFVEMEQRLGEASDSNIVSEAHQKIGEVVHNSGGVYKPSGAGNGDLGVAFCKGIAKRQEVEQALAEHDFDVIGLTLQTSKAKEADLQEV